MDDERVCTPHLSYAAEEFWPHYSQDEIEAVSRVLRSGRVNQWTGDDVAAFEQSCRQRFGGGPGIAVANGSVALELALLAFGVGPGDEVVVTPRSFIASASCVRLVGATPIFADVEPDSGNVSAHTIERVLTSRTTAVIPVHLAGWPCDMPGIMALARKHGLRVIEDCAQSHGATVDGQPTGSFGDAACFSFCQDKIVSTAGEGGYVSFRDKATYNWAWSFKDHGKNRYKLQSSESTSFEPVHDMIGTNWRMPGPQAAVGFLQLQKLPDWLEARARNATIWAQALGDVPGLHVPRPSDRFGHAYYKFYFYVDAGPDSVRVRQGLLEMASEAGLRLFGGSCSEIYLEQAFADLPRPHCPIAHQLGQTSLMVEVHPTLDPELTRLRADWLAQAARSLLTS